MPLPEKKTREIQSTEPAAEIPQEPGIHTETAPLPAPEVAKITGETGRAAAKISAPDIKRSIKQLQPDLQDFFKQNELPKITINQSAKDTHLKKGSSCHVLPACIKGKDEGIVAKIYHRNDLKVLAYALREGQYLKIAGDIGVGPKFYGFHITENGLIAVLMEKVKGYDLEESGRYYVNEKSINEFTAKNKKMNDAGYAFAGEGGQIMVSEDGSLTFIDITIEKLDQDGKTTETPDYTDMYQYRLESLTKYLNLGTTIGQEVSFFSDDGKAINKGWHVIGVDKEAGNVTVRGRGNNGQNLRTTLPIPELRKEILFTEPLRNIPATFTVTGEQNRQLYHDAKIDGIDPVTGKVTVIGNGPDGPEKITFSSAKILELSIFGRRR